MIRRLCYELYKIDWKRNHMITPEIEMRSIKDYYNHIENLNDDMYTYNDYLDEFGYNRTLYVEYNEFCEHEYKDTEYMCSLLSDEDLITMYYKDIEFRRN